MYYWCKLTFDDNFNITERHAIESFKTEQEIIEYMSREIRKLMSREIFKSRMYKTAFRAPNPETGLARALEKLEHMQQLSGDDSYYIGNSLDEFTPTYCIHQHQLCYENKGVVKIIDIRRWHDKILAHALAFYGQNLTHKPAHNKHSCRKRRKHRTDRRVKNVHNTLKLIDDGMLRSRFASKYYGGVMYGGVSTSENNWKQTKCRHQWERHINRHQDAMLMPEINDMDEDMYDEDAYAA